MFSIGRKGKGISKAKSSACLDEAKASQRKGSVENRLSKASLLAQMEHQDRLLAVAVDQKDWHEVLRILHRAEATFSEDCAGRNKKDYHFYLAIICNNKAFALNELQNEQEASSLMRKCLHHLGLVQKSLSNREEQVAFKTLAVKMGLKYCALLSHSQQHEEAIAQAEQILSTIASCLLALVEACTYSCHDYTETPQTEAASEYSRQKRERVDFKRIVVKEAERMLSKIDEIPSPGELLGSLKGYFQQKMQNMYFWRDNESNNIKSISKELFRSDSKDKERNLLGIQKSSLFIEQFALSEVMSLDLLRFSFRVNTDLCFLLSSPKIVELVLLASVCYFLIATEKRFKQGNLDLSKMKIAERYSCLGSDQPLGESKVLHLKAIELAGHHLPSNNQYLLHLINSFNKNYKSVLDEIKEESEIVRQSAERLSLKAECRETSTSTSAWKPRKKKTERLEQQRQTHHLGDKKHSPKKKDRCKSGAKRLRTEPQAT